MPAEAYGVVLKTFWTDPDIKRKLTREQKHLFLYLCTSPHSTMIGVYYCPIAYMANEADLPLEEIRRFLSGPLAPHVTYDEQTEEVFVHALAKHGIGDELKIGKDGKPDRRIEGVRRQLQAVHSPRLQRAFLARYGAAYKLNMPLPEQREAPSEPLASPLPSPSEALAVAGTEQEPTCSVPTEPGTPVGESSPSEGAVLATIREVLWRPDGKPPADWSEGREISVIRALVERGETTDDLIRAVHGLRLLQDQGNVDWLAPNAKVTLRAIYHSKNGSRDMLTQALDAYASGPPPPEPKAKPGQRQQDVKRADFLAAAERFRRAG